MITINKASIYTYSIHFGIKIYLLSDIQIYIAIFLPCIYILDQKRIKRIQKKKTRNVKNKVCLLKGVFAKNERGYRLNAIKKRF